MKLLKLRVLDQDGEYKSRLVLKVVKKRYSKSRNYVEFIHFSFCRSCWTANCPSSSSTCDRFLNPSSLWKFPEYCLVRYIPSALLATIAYCSLYLSPTSKVPTLMS